MSTCTVLAQMAEGITYLLTHHFRAKNLGVYTAFEIVLIDTMHQFARILGV